MADPNRFVYDDLSWLKVQNKDGSTSTLAELSAKKSQPPGAPAQPPVQQPK